MEIKIECCPFCKGNEFIEARQIYGEAYVSAQAILGQELKYTICRNCGSVVRSYVQYPENLLKKKDRRVKE